jgi:hypothetical protein
MANNSPPSGYVMLQRENAKYAMGTLVCLKGVAIANNAMTVTGLRATDIVIGCIDLTTVATAQGDVAAMTPATDALSSSATPWTGTRNYMVLAYRAQADGR